MVFYVVTVLFMGGTYFHHMLMRVVVSTITFAVMIIHRSQVFDNINIIQGFAVTYTIVATLEISTYINYKAKAELFIKVKISE